MVTIIVIVLILALLFGGLGLLVEGLVWLAIIGLVLLVVGAILGFTNRGRAA